MLDIIGWRKILWWAVGTVLLAHSVFVHAAPQTDEWVFWSKADTANKESIDHSVWQSILDKYLVTGHSSKVNLFDYGKVSKADRKTLTGYIDAMQALDPRSYSRDEQFAYWVNLYNALTVRLIVDAYPVSSIKELGGSLFSSGPWDEDVAEIAGKNITLNDIEHRILRPIWKDPRIHFAVNCASMGCPDLQNKAFTADNTEKLLNNAARDYLLHPRGAHFQGEQLVLSKIFDWYQADFGNTTQAMLAAISAYAPKEKAQRIKDYDGKPKYAYDWNLNVP